MLHVQTMWGWPIALYLFLAGVSAGTYLVAAYWQYAKKQDYLVKIGVYLTAPCLGLSIFVLWLDLGQRMRFPYAFLRPQESWISIGAWLLTLFFILSAVQWLKQYSNRKKEVMPEKEFGLLWSIGIVLALLTAIYTGILLGVAQAIPFWNTPVLPVLFLISALSTGIGAVLLVAVVSKQSREAVHLDATGIHLLAKVDIVLIMLEIMCLVFYVYIMAKSGVAAAASTHMIINGSLALLFWLVVIVIGLLMPFIIEFISFQQGKAVVKETQTALTGISLLFGGLVLRYIILAAGVYESFSPFM